MIVKKATKKRSSSSDLYKEIEILFNENERTFPMKRTIKCNNEVKLSYIAIYFGVLCRFLNI